MKKLLYVILAAMGALMFVQCSDWTEMEPKFTEPVNINGEDYYKALREDKEGHGFCPQREYKKSDHQVVFGWYSEWTGTGTNMNNQLRGIPDSMDIVSLWGNAFNLTEAQKSDLKEVREKKGTRVLYCQHIMDIGRAHTPASVENDFIVDGVQYASKGEAMAAYWGWYEGWPNRNGYGDTSPEGIEKAIRKYARVIADSIIKYGYDGFDIDYEPNFDHRGNMSGSDENMLLFIQTLGERIGPKSGTDRLLVIDGEPQSIVSESGPYFNYFIVQAYDSPGDNTGRDNLDSRLNSTIRNFDGHLTAEEVAKKYIVTENFEKWALSGGADFTDRYGNKMKSLEGMARWTPIINGKKCVKGGVGTYHMEYEYTIDGTEESYPYLRNAIRIMNPPVK